jgi:hypothetical protein
MFVNKFSYLADEPFCECFTWLSVQECDANVDGGWKLEQVQVPAQFFHAVRQPVDVERLRTFTEK